MHRQSCLLAVVLICASCGSQADDPGSNDSVVTMSRAGTTPKTPGIRKIVDDLDLSFPSKGFPFALRRSYSLDSETFGPYGTGWVHSYMSRVSVQTNDDVVLLNEDGTTSYFVSNGDGSFQSSLGDYRSLVKNPDSTFRLDTPPNRIHEFDPQGFLTRIRDGHGNGQSLTYNPDNRLLRITDDSSRELNFSYDADGRLTFAIAPDGRSVTYAYDADSRLTSVTNGTGTWSYGYDSNSLLSSITSPDGRTTLLTSEDGLLASVADSNGRNEITFDFTTPNKILATDGLGHVLQFDYEDDGTISAMRLPTGGTIQFGYDANFNVQSLVDPNGTTTSFSYDNRGNLLSLTDPNGNTTTYKYDSDDQVTSLTDARGHTTSYEYVAGSLTRIVSPSGEEETMSYDASGQLLSRTNRRGETMLFEYDDRGLLTREVAPDGSATTYQYDVSGNMTMATNEHGSVNMTYDAFDRLIEETNPDGHTTLYSFDAGGRRSRLVYPDGTELDYDYDDLGRLTTLSRDGSDLVSYSYDAASRVVERLLGNGLKSTLEWDGWGHLLSLVTRKSTGDVVSAAWMQYDAYGNCIRKRGPQGTTHYAYDAAHQLTSVVQPSGIRTLYDFDAVGNRRGVWRHLQDSPVFDTSVNIPPGPAKGIPYQTNELDQYVKVGNTTYVHDANGNVIRKNSPEGTTTYDYDVYDRLISVATPTSQVFFEYDALGRPLAKNSTGKTTRYVYDGFEMLVAINPAQESHTNFVHGLSYDELVAGLTHAVDIYFVRDENGSVIHITDPDESIVESYLYDEYGFPIKASDLGNPFLFNGRRYDAETGLYYYRARFYDPSLGRFISEDPSRPLLVETNYYTYSRNDPKNRWDPTGLRSSSSSVQWAPTRGAVNYGSPLTPEKFAEPLCELLAVGVGQLGWNLVGTALTTVRQRTLHYLGQVGLSPLQEVGLRAFCRGLGEGPPGSNSGDPTFIQPPIQGPSVTSGHSENTSSDGLIARISVPVESSLVRAHVPVFGLAHGPKFESYRVEIGRGDEPSEWTSVFESQTPETEDVTFADIDDSSDRAIYGNLATWNTGLTNYIYNESHGVASDVDLKGRYTIRLTVFGKDGAMARDQVRVDVGNVIPNAWGGVVSSEDEGLRIEFDEHSLLRSFRVISAERTEDLPAPLPSTAASQTTIYRLRESSEPFLRSATVHLRVDEASSSRRSLFGYDDLMNQWVELETSEQAGTLVASIDRLYSHIVGAQSLADTNRETEAPEPTSTVIAGLEDFDETTVENLPIHPRFEKWSPVLALEESSHDDSQCLRVTQASAFGPFALTLSDASFDARQYPSLHFDYRIPADVTIDLWLKAGERWFVIPMSGSWDDVAYSRTNVTVLEAGTPVHADGNWHHFEVDLYEALREKTGQTTIHEIGLAHWKVDGYMKLMPGYNRAYASYWLDNFALFRRPIDVSPDPRVIADFEDESEPASRITPFTSEHGATQKHRIVGTSETNRALEADVTIEDQGGFAGFAWTLAGMDLREYQRMTVRVSGAEATSLGVWIASGSESTHVPGHEFPAGTVADSSTLISLPLTRFYAIQDWSDVDTLSIGISAPLDSSQRLLLDDIEFHKTLGPLNLLEFDNGSDVNVLGRSPQILIPGAAGEIYLEGACTEGDFYRLVYGGKIGAEVDGVDGFGWALWQTDLAGISLEEYETLSLRVRGEAGGEKVNLYVDDGGWHWSVRLGDYREIDVEWQQIDIPLDVFGRHGVDLTHVERISLGFEWEPMEGAIHIDDLRLR